MILPSAATTAPASATNAFAAAIASALIELGILFCTVSSSEQDCSVVPTTILKGISNGLFALNGVELVRSDCLGDPRIFKAIDVNRTLQGHARRARTIRPLRHCRCPNARWLQEQNLRRQEMQTWKAVPKAHSWRVEANLKHPAKHEELPEANLRSLGVVLRRPLGVSGNPRELIPKRFSSDSRLHSAFSRIQRLPGAAWRVLTLGVQSVSIQSNVEF